MSAASINLRPGNETPINLVTVFMPVQREIDIPKTVESIAAIFPTLESICFIYQSPMTEYKAQTGAPFNKANIVIDSIGFSP